MIHLLPSFHALCGHGVTINIKSNKITISGDKSFLVSLDLQPIQHNKALVINALPHGVDITPRLIVSAIEDYQERVTVLMQDDHLSRLEAENRAFFGIRGYINNAL